MFRIIMPAQIVNEEHTVSQTPAFQGLESDRADAKLGVAVSDGTRFTLFPFMIRPFDGSNCTILRLGFPQVTAITTSALGARAVKLLRLGKSVLQTKKTLAADNQSAGSIDLSSLIKALFQAKLIRSVDGKDLSSVRPSRLRLLRQRFLLLGKNAGDMFSVAVMRALPANIAYGVLYVLQYLAIGRRRRTRFLAETNLKLAFGGLLPPRLIHKLTIQYCRERAARSMTGKLFRNLPHERTIPWLQSATEVHGLENLAAARSTGKGVLLCGLHFSAAELIMATLWLHGQSFCGVGEAPPPRAKEWPAKFTLDEQSLPGGIRGCGTVTWYSKASFEGARGILKTLNSSGTALVFLDGYPPRPNKEIARYFGHRAGEYLPGRTSVILLNQRVSANTAVAWMAAQTGALVVPLKLLRQRSCRYQLMICPAVEISAQDSLTATTQRLYSLLETNIYLHPSQWIYWDRLGELLVRGMHGRS